MINKRSVCANYSPLAAPKDLPQRNSCRYCLHYSTLLGGCELRDVIEDDE